MPHQTGMGHFVIGWDAVAVHVGDDDILHLIHLRRQDSAAVVFHHAVGAGLEESGVGPALVAGHRVLGLVAVAVAGGGGQDGNSFQALAADSVQASADALRLQPGFLLIVHVPEVAAAAELRHGAFPIHPVRRTLQNFHQLAGGPGLLGLLDAHPNPFAQDGIGDEHGAALDFCHGLTFGGVVADYGLVNFVFYQHGQSSVSIIMCRGRRPIFS